jgi:hypothetical protein
MPVPTAVLDLVARFADNRDVYCAQTYNEAQLRQEFIHTDYPQ